MQQHGGGFFTSPKIHPSHDLPRLVFAPSPRWLFGISAINSTKIELLMEADVFFSFEKNHPFFLVGFSKSRRFLVAHQHGLNPPPENAKNFIRGKHLGF